VTVAGDRAPAVDGLRAVIFDMDGVLIDTEPVWRSVEMEVFASLGLHLTEADCRETMGLRIVDVVQLWYARRSWTGAPRHAVVDRILAGVSAHVSRHGVAIEGALDAIAVVRRAGLLCALASSSPPSLMTMVIEKLRIAGEIDVACSAASELRGKPAPDVYLRAASLLEVPPAGCLAIEDSVNGVLSARAAGMPCIVVPDAVTASDPRLDAATLRFQSLLELDDRRLESLRADYFA
jgi:mannitol-1-/sugar-/sorbitol-6-/2-deoxyglucose-6-phosphatase